MLHRVVFLLKSTTVPHFVCSTKELYVLLADVFAVDGILHSMAQNVEDQRQLKELFTFHQPNLHRHRHIEGYCNRVPKGQIRVSIRIGRCATYSLGDSITGWNSMSRIVIEEVPPPQS